MARNRKATVSKGVPPETSTEEWRIMSASIAYALWADPARALQLNECDEAPEEWTEIAAAYRARIRAVLRQVLAEGIRFENDLAIPESEPRDKDWWSASARFAWLLWLRKRREKRPSNEPLERLAWADEAESYRVYVRSAVKNLEAQGICLKS